MKRCSVILLLFLLATIATVAQETYLNTTLRKQPWSDLPVIYVNEAKGGLQTLELELNGLSASEISDSINTLVLPNFRQEGMVVVNTNASGNSRFFQLLATDTWREVFIITSWQAGVQYIPGQPILHNGNLFIAKDTIIGVEPLIDTEWKAAWANLGGLDSTDLDFALKTLGNLEDVAINQDLNPMQTDTLDLGSALLRWSNLYLSDTIFMKGDTVANIANAGEAFASKADSAKAITTLLTVDSMIAEGGNDINFAFGAKKITRPGWTGVTGNNVNAENLEEFLQKVFFPMPAPLINSFGVPNQSTQTLDANQNIVSSVGTYTIPYATWVADAGLTLSFDVDNRTDAASDPTDELPAIAINTLKVTKGGADVGLYTIVDGTTDQAGTISIDAADVTVNPTSTSSNVFTLSVIDDYPNTNTLDLNVTMSQALQSLVQNNVAITHPSSEGTNPYLIERNGATQTFTVTYRVDSRDETVTDVAYTAYGGITAPANETGLNITADNVVRTVTIDVENTNLNVVRLGVQVKGDIYGALSTERLSPTLQLADRGYMGYLTNAQRIALLGQGATIAAFSNANCLMNYQFKNTAGLTLQNNIGETGYLCFALPVSKENTGKTFTIETYDLGVWTAVTTRQEIYDITTNGATVSYYVICIDDGAANTSDGGSVTARVIE